MAEKTHIAILGAGPIGLEAALAATEAGVPFTVYESADRVAGHVRCWAHVRLFTPWTLSVSPRMRQALTNADLADAGHSTPDDPNTCPTGGDLVEKVFEPLAASPALRDHLRLGVEVRSIGRRGLLKHEEIGSGERASRPFRLLVRDADGRETVDEATTVLDCTGNSVPNPIGDGGIPAPGEGALDNGSLVHDIPDFESEAEAWRGKKVLLVGGGHSAQTAIRDLVGLGDGTSVEWVLRAENPSWGVADDDPLPERNRLGRAAAEIDEHPPAGLRIHRGAVVEALSPSNGHVRVTLREGLGTKTSVTVDRILALTGRVGDHRLYRQLQVHECYATAGPMKLAAALMSASGAGGDCLAQTSQGAETLTNPEPGFFILGSKSYGRRTDFLMRVGWEQVDEVFGLLGTDQGTPG